jgi:hypothetical protein
VARSSPSGEPAGATTPEFRKREGSSALVFIVFHADDLFTVGAGFKPAPTESDLISWRTLQGFA